MDSLNKNLLLCSPPYLGQSVDAITTEDDLFDLVTFSNLIEQRSRDSIDNLFVASFKSSTAVQSNFADRKNIRLHDEFINISSSSGASPFLGGYTPNVDSPVPESPACPVQRMAYHDCHTPSLKSVLRAQTSSPRPFKIKSPALTSYYPILVNNIPWNDAPSVGDKRAFVQTMTVPILNSDGRKELKSCYVDPSSLKDILQESPQVSIWNQMPPTEQLPWTDSEPCPPQATPVLRTGRRHLVVPHIVESPFETYPMKVSSPRHHDDDVEQPARCNSFDFLAPLSPTLRQHSISAPCSMQQSSNVSKVIDFADVVKFPRRLFDAFNEADMAAVATAIDEFCTLDCEVQTWNFKVSSRDAIKDWLQRLKKSFPDFAYLFQNGKLHSYPDGRRVIVVQSLVSGTRTDSSPSMLDDLFLNPGEGVPAIEAERIRNIFKHSCATGQPYRITGNAVHQLTLSGSNNVVAISMDVALTGVYQSQDYMF